MRALRANLSTLAQRLRQQRLARGFHTYEALSLVCGVTASQIGKYERGLLNPSTANAVKLAQALRVSVEALTQED